MSIIEKNGNLDKNNLWGARSSDTRMAEKAEI